MNGAYRADGDGKLIVEFRDAEGDLVGVIDAPPLEVGEEVVADVLAGDGR